MIKKLVYHKSFGAFNFANVEIKVVKGKVHFSKSGTANIENVSDGISEFGPEEMSKKIEKIGIDNWAGKYITNDVVLDGENWYVKITMDDGQSLYVSGENAYPYNWDDFLYALSMIVGKVV